MKIVLTNWELRKPGGSQLWTYTMYQALKLIGHDVSVFTPKPGSFTQLFNNVENSMPTNADLILSNQSIGNGNNIPTISTSHSTFVPMEKFRPGANKYVSVSEEVKNSDHNKGFTSQVILNPVNHTLYSPKRKTKELKTVLYMNHDGGNAYDIIKKACDEFGLNLITFDGEIDTYRIINKAELCIGIGRCLIEAMSCGRSVVSADHRSWMDSFTGYGVITPENYQDAQKDNYSGRTNPKQITKEYLLEVFKNYDSDLGDKLRKKTVQQHNYIKIAADYLKLYETM